MRSLILLGLLGACDPIWHVSNVTTPTAMAHPDEACIDRALHATTFTVTATEPHRWSVSSPGTAVGVIWEPEQPPKLRLIKSGMGTEPPPGTLQSYRLIRDGVLAKVSEMCGAFDPGLEECGRMQCGTAVP